MKITIIRLRGGLGNQMFQLAAGLSFSNFNLIKYIFLDTSLINLNKKNETKRKYELGIFNLKLCNILVFKINRYIIEFIYVMLKKISLIKTINNKNFKNNNKYLFYVLDDYFQNEEFFLCNLSQIKNIFNLNHLVEKFSNLNSLLLQKILLSNSVSIHVRRGDYLNSKNINIHGICNLEYYKEAINYINKYQNEITYFIFSDDSEWCKDNFTFLNSNKLNFVTKNETNIDLFLMSNCKHNIIANSTFSWWAAWLNTNPNKIVIAPKIWFVGNSFENEIVPKRWIKI